MPLAVERVVPILRIFDVAKAREFYVDYLGCVVDSEHQFDGQGPRYMQIRNRSAGGTMMLPKPTGVQALAAIRHSAAARDCRHKKVKENLFVERVCGPEAQSPDQIRIIEVLPPKTPLGMEP